MLTVIMATRDRAGSLRKVLAAMRALDSPPGGWRLVVVDNNADENAAAETGKVLRDFAGSLPLLVLREPRPGMTRALNRALGAIAGDHVVKADDDFLPDGDWLVRFRAAADAHPQASIFGGTARPYWTAAPPDWLWRDARAMAILFALSDRPDGPCPPETIYGPHWAARADLFAQGARFNEAVGPGGGSAYTMGGETELFARLQRQGHVAHFVAGAGGRHIVRLEQFDEAWILGRARACGRGAALVTGVGRSRLRTAAWRAASFLARPLPRSALRMRIRFTAQLVAGMAEMRHGA